MMIIMQKKATQKEIEKVNQVILKLGLETNLNKGNDCFIIGILGDTNKVDQYKLLALNGVEKVIKVQEPYKMVNRKFHPEDSIIQVHDQKIGGNHLCVIAGPCSVESEEQIIDIAKSVKEAGATMLRGGAFKPRTSPYSFQGLELEGLKMLIKAKEVTNLPIVTEITSTKYLDIYIDHVDLIQVGARNMQNFDLLKELGKIDKPILLKRGLSATYEEWLMAAEYIFAGGNQNIILCERGIRTFETYTRNTLDLQAIPVIKKITHLPIIIDPSHAGGKSWLVEPMSKAAIVAGADGLMIEVHNEPENALSDGPQSIRPSEFKELMGKIRRLSEIEGRMI